MAHHLKVGDRVRVKVDNTDGNPRTPRYVRNKVGVVVELHGVRANPLDHRDIYPPLCTVAFEVREVFGASSIDKLYVDIHEDWLDRA